MPPGTTTQVWNGTGPLFPPISKGGQNIEVPRRFTIPQEVSNAKPLKSSININPDKHRDTMPSWSKVIGSKTFTNESADVYVHVRMNFGSDTVLSKIPNFMDFGLSSVSTTDELGSVFISTIRSGRQTNGSNWLPSGHNTSEATVDSVSGTKDKNHCNLKVNLKLGETKW